MFRHDELMALFSQPMQFPWLYEFKERIEQRFNIRVAYIEYDFAQRIQRNNFSVYMYSKADYEAIAVFNGFISDINERILDDMLSDIFAEGKIVGINFVKVENYHCFIECTTFEELMRYEYGLISEKYTSDIRNEVNTRLAVFRFINSTAVCIFENQREIDDFIQGGKFKRLNDKIISILKSVDKYGFIQDNEVHVICDTLDSFRANPMYLRDI